MIDPYAITDFDRDDFALQEFWLFAMAVAGKKAVGIAPKIHSFIHDCGHPGTPFERVAAMIVEGSLRANLERVKLGKYRDLTKGYSQTVERRLDIQTAPIEDLEAICGVASKTARFFVLHSRKDARVGVIDTHMLKYLRSKGHDAPMTVPTGKKYAALEGIVLDEAEKSGLSFADFDLKIWTAYASGEVKEIRPRKAANNKSKAAPAAMAA